MQSGSQRAKLRFVAATYFAGAIALCSPITSSAVRTAPAAKNVLKAPVSVEKVISPVEIYRPKAMSCKPSAEAYAKNVKDAGKIAQYIKEELRCQVTVTRQPSESPVGTFLGFGETVEPVELKVSGGPMTPVPPTPPQPPSCNDVARRLYASGVEAARAYTTLVERSGCVARIVDKNSDAPKGKYIEWQPIGTTAAHLHRFGAKPACKRRWCQRLWRGGCLHRIGGKAPVQIRHRRKKFR
jgi:hypothetical protein